MILKNTPKGNTLNTFKNNTTDTVQIRSCRLKTEELNWLFETGNQLLSMGKNQKLEHWWVIIKDLEDKQYYVTQFYGNSVIILEKVDSYSEAIQRGLECVKKKSGETWCEYQNRTLLHRGGLKDMVDWIGKYNSNYSLASNNCQHYAANFADYFTPNYSRPIVMEQDRKIHIVCQIF